MEVVDKPGSELNGLMSWDNLTFSQGHKGFMVLGQHTLNICMRFDKPVTLMLFNIDFFKVINEAYGYTAGDEALINFTSLLVKNFRDSDLIARLGEDNFAALLTNSSQEEVHIVISRLDNLFSDYNEKSDHEYKLDYSYIAVEYDQSLHINLEELLRDAESRMRNMEKQESTDLDSDIDTDVEGQDLPDLL